MSSGLRCVLDASVVAKTFLYEDHTCRAQALLQHLSQPPALAHVPDLLYVEVANIAWKAVAQARFTGDRALRAIAIVRSLRFTAHAVGDLVEHALSIALEWRITAYDACYAALSAQVEAPLVTADERLVRAMAGSRFDVRALPDLDASFFD